jgi:CotH kinase protein/Lamin Tail Domain/Secretion system C-terminal sorting domain
MTFRIILLFLIGTVFCKAQVVINEFSASNLRDFNDDYDKGEDWIELYNNSDQSINIGGWYMSDKIDKPKKWQIPVGTTIGPKGFMTFWASGRNTANGDNIHTNFRFTQTSTDEYVVLSDINGKVIESYKLPITLLGHSIGKSEDGNANWVINTLPTFNASNNEAPQYTAYTPTPLINKVAGAYSEKLYVKTTNNSIYTCRYTLDGSLPVEDSPIMEDSVEISETAIFKARYFSNDSTILPGKIAYATFFINEPLSTLPIVSVASELAIELAEGNRDLKPFSSFEFFSKEGKLIATSYGELDSHGQDSWVNPQRSIDWISRDEMGYNSGIPYKLFNYSDRDDYQRIILRASGDDNYPSIGDKDHEGSAHIRDEYVHTLVQQGDMKMDVRAVERALVYINGKYWGVYTMREKPDDTDYTEYTYKQDKFNVQFLKTWGNSWAEYGGNKAFEDWAKVRDFILKNDMSNTDNYNKVLEDYNVISLMDYMIANLSAVSSDWLNYNTGWWRGLDPKGDHKKWAYVMWDNDATFDYYINYSGVPNIAPDAKACDIEDISQYMDVFFPQDSSFQFFPGDSFYIDGEWVYFPPDSFWVVPDIGKHEKIFLKLLEENESFRNQYYARYADMISTTFSCKNMIHTLDSLVDIIKPEMPRQVARWGGSMNEWQKNVNKIKDFISERCTKIADGMVDCYNELKGPYAVTLVSDPPNEGTIKFNTLSHTSLPWTGTYFGGMNNAIEVKQNGTAKFKKWVSKSGNTTFANASITNTNATLSGTDTLIAVFENGVTASEEPLIGSAFISPNPASSYVTVHTDLPCIGCTFSIIDNLGKTVHKGNFSNQTVNIETLINGIYTLKLFNKSDVRYIGKVMVVR